MKIARHELEDKMWYRFLKVLYKIVYFLALLSLIGAIGVALYLVSIGESGMFGVILFLVLALIVTPFVFKMMAKKFFYIVTGENK